MPRKVYVFIDRKFVSSYAHNSERLRNFKEFGMMETFTNVQALHNFLKDRYAHRSVPFQIAYSTFAKDIKEDDFYHDPIRDFSILRTMPKNK